MGIEYTDKRSNVFIREMTFEGWNPVPSHRHNFPHVHHISRGVVDVDRMANGEAERTVRVSARDGRNWLLIEKGVEHRMRPVLTFEVDTAKLRHALAALLPPETIEAVIVASSDEVLPLGHCIYAHRTPQGAVVQEYTGWGPAYG